MAQYLDMAMTGTIHECEIFGEKPLSSTPATKTETTATGEDEQNGRAD